MDVKRVLLATMLAAAVAACGDAGPDPSGLDTQPPPAPDLSRIEVIPPVIDGVARLVGEAGAVEGSALVRVVNTSATNRDGEVVDAGTNAAPDGSFDVQIPAELGDNLTITAADEAGNVSAPSTTKSGPDLVPFTATEVGALQLLSFGQEGAVALPFPSGSERYAVVAQSLNPSGGQFDLKVTGGWGTRIEERQLAPAAGGSRVPMEAAIREVERRAWPLLAAAGPARGRRLRGAQDIGEKRQFFVVNRGGSIDLDNPDDFDEVTATLRFVDDHTLIYVDDRTPGANLPPSVIQAVGERFDDQIYPTDRAAFGEESDVDGNGKVIILLTPTVNANNTEETLDEGVVQLGFFFAIDLFARSSQLPFSNEGEIFYAIVPDPTAQFSPAEFPLEGIEDLLSSVFAHEFEHMISANQHIFVRGGQQEQIWLDEGLAHHAETLNGFRLQNRLRSALFLDDPQNTSLSAGDDTLERRGAAWLFVQYLVDQLGDEILGRLVQTRRTGIANVEQAADRSMTLLFHEWSSTLYLDDISDDPVFNIAVLDLREEFELARQALRRPLGTYLDLVQRALGGSTGVTLTRELAGMAAAYYEVHAAEGGTRPIVVSTQSGASLQTAIVRIE